MQRERLALLGVGELAPLLKQKDVSPLEVVDVFLERAERLNGTLHAFITVDPEQARAEARAAEQAIMRGEYRGPLHGIPVVYKDILYTKGLRTTAHTKVGGYEHFVPDYDATLVERMKAAGAITLAKANTYEFAVGGMEHYGTARNPWNPDCWPGGSSSGSAVALAAHMTTAAIGHDTGGSLRIPAAFCGVVGYRSTYGYVSRHGYPPLTWSKDVAGPMTKTVADTALIMNAIAGHDPRDRSTTTRPVPDFTALLGKDVKGMRLGVPRVFFYEDLHPDVAAALERALAEFAGLGVELVEIEIPHADLVGPAAYVIMFAEGAAIHELELDREPQNFGTMTYHRLEQGRFLTAVEYIRAQRFREWMIRAVNERLAGLDGMVMPTVAFPAYRLDDRVGRQFDAPRFTRLASFTGQPAISIPCGFTQEGMPVGMMIMGHAWQDEKVLQLAHAYEQAAGWHRRVAPIALEGAAEKEGV